MWRLLLLLAGCDRVFGFDDVGPPTGDGGGSGVDDATSDATRFTDWTVPRPLIQVNSMSLESDASLTGDGLELYFTSTRGGIEEIFVSKRATVDDDFPAPTRVTQLTSAFKFGSISPDGLTFWGNRIVNVDSQIYSATRANRTLPFGAAVFEPGLSSPLNDINPSISADGLTVILTREATTTDDDLWVGHRAALDAPWEMRELGELNSTWLDSAASTDEKGLYIVFHSDRTTHDRLSDLYSASRPSPDVEFVFTTLQPLSQLNTSMKEFDPAITPDSRIIVFARGPGDLYISTRTPL